MASPRRRHRRLREPLGAEVEAEPEAVVQRLRGPLRTPIDPCRRHRPQALVSQRVRRWSANIPASSACSWTRVSSRRGRTKRQKSPFGVPVCYHSPPHLYPHSRTRTRPPIPYQKQRKPTPASISTAAGEGEGALPLRCRMQLTHL